MKNNLVEGNQLIYFVILNGVMTAKFFSSNNRKTVELSNSLTSQKESLILAYAILIEH